MTDPWTWLRWKVLGKGDERKAWVSAAGRVRSGYVPITTDYLGRARVWWPHAFSGGVVQVVVSPEHEPPVTILALTETGLDWFEIMVIDDEGNRFPHRTLWLGFIVEGYYDRDKVPE